MKKVAATLKEISGSEIYARIMDPKDELEDLIEEVKGWWKFDLFGRSPTRALVDEGGNLLKPTDLDLACFLAALASRNAVIKLPTYKVRRPRQLRDDEWVTSAENRHGKLVGLTSNKEAFSFSALMIDANVVRQVTDEKQEVGAFRNFMIVDLDGHFYDGWRVIEFVPSRKENDFLARRGLWTDDKIVFDRFVHPNRWVSFFGQPYVLTKILIARLEAEARDLYYQANTPLDLVSASEDEKDGEGARASTGSSKSEKVRSFAAEVDSPTPLPEGFPTYEREAAAARLKKVRYADLPELRFAARATELAFCQRARCFDALVAEGELPGEGPPPEPFPGWISGTKFEDHLIKRTTWRRVVLHQDVPFMKGLAIRYRVRWKSERVAA